MAKVSGGRLVADALIARGAEHVFSVSGGHVNAIYEHLEVEGSPTRVLTTRHEQAAVFMAEAWGRMTRRPGVALVTAGPGFTNALSGIANARLSNAPLLLVAGAVGLASEERLDLQDMHQLPVISPMVKAAFVCHTTERIPELLDLAWRTAASGRPGPVYLEIPVDVLGAEVDEARVRRLHTVPRSRPVDPAGVDAVLEALRSARRPVLIAGSGAWYADADKELVDFVEMSGVPTFTVSQGRGTLPDTHRLCFESALPIRPGAGPAADAGADLVILLGSRLSLFHAFGDLFQPDAVVVQVDTEPEEIGRNRHVDLPVVSDVRAFLAACHDRLASEVLADSLPDRFAPWVASLRAARDEALAGAESERASDAVPIHPLRLAAELDAFMDREDDVVVADGGDTQVWMGMTRTVRAAGRYLDSGLYGCLGVGLPYAHAAKLRHPDARVLLATGDGSVGFNFMEFETALRKGLPVVTVVFNDCGWGMIRHSQVLGLGRSIDEGSELGRVPYHAMVEALGGFGALVERPGEIRPALEAAFASGRPACVNVMTDPEPISPGSVALAMLGGYTGAPTPSA